MEVIHTHDLKKLIAAGRADDEACQEAWEKIVSKNYEENGGFDYFNYMDLAKGYGSLLAEYTLTKAQIMKLLFGIDDGIINELKDKGYKIDTSGNKKFIESINTCLVRCENIVSRIRMKANEISDMVAENGGSKPTTFDETIASVSFQLGFELPDNVTLARFNGYRKILLEKHARMNKPIDI